MFDRENILIKYNSKYDETFYLDSNTTQKGKIQKGDLLTSLKNIGIKGDTAKITTKTKSASFTDMMGDLEVNMPMLLDITLENSKVFKALEQKVNSFGGMDMKTNIDTKSTSISQKTLETIQRNIMNLNKKVDAVESSLAFVQKGEKVLELEKEANYSNTKNTADIKKIEKRLSNLEKSSKSCSRHDSDGSSLISRKTGTVAKISLGLSLIVALFVAR